RYWSVTGVQTCALPICRDLAVPVHLCATTAIPVRHRSHPALDLALAPARGLGVLPRRGGGKADHSHGASLAWCPCSGGCGDLIPRCHKPPARERRPIVVRVLHRALREFHLLPRQLLVGDQAE